MFKPPDYRDLLRGKKRGVAATLLRAALRIAEPFYTLAVWWRNRRYDRGRAEVHPAGVPVVCVGNLTVGGTGKTPMVEWLARWFRARNVRVAIVSRGYGAERGALNDEALELEQKLPDVPHVQNPDRVEAARVAVEELDCQLILLDDGFQHRRLARDLDLVLLDALDPFGLDHLLPRGLLREPLSGLRRAAVVALSRADQVDAERRDEVRTQVAKIAPNAVWVEVAHKPSELLDSDGRSVSLEVLRDRRAAAFCGIGNPDGFRGTLEALTAELVDFREFADHHPYSARDIVDLEAWAESLPDIDAVLCTHKDLVKIGLPKLGGHPLWALRIGIEATAGKAELEQLLEAIAAKVQT
ncbi:MAG: tetraacyldisaccharide 4'-kinase [Pirellulaceae bacterium]